MILISTLRKLAAKDASVYVVNVPSYAIKLPTGVHTVPAYREAFATMAQAIAAGKRMNPQQFNVALAPSITTSTAKGEALRDGWAF